MVTLDENRLLGLRLVTDSVGLRAPDGDRLGVKSGKSPALLDTKSGKSPALFEVKSGKSPALIETKSGKSPARITA